MCVCIRLVKNTSLFITFPRVKGLTTITLLGLQAVRERVA